MQPPSQQQPAFDANIDRMAKWRLISALPINQQKQLVPDAESDDSNDAMPGLMLIADLPANQPIQLMPEVSNSEELSDLALLAAVATENLPSAVVGQQQQESIDQQEKLDPSAE